MFVWYSSLGGGETMKNSQREKELQKDIVLVSGPWEVLDCRFNTGEGKSKRAARTSSGP